MTLTALFNRREISTETRFEVLERDRYACVYCRSKVDFYSARFTEAWHSDKSLPPHVYSLRTACASCNAEKGNRGENEYWFWKILKNLRIASAA